MSRTQCGSTFTVSSRPRRCNTANRHPALSFAGIGFPLDGRLATAALISVPIDIMMGVLGALVASSSSLPEMIELLLAHDWDIDNGQMLHDANHGHGTRVRTWLTYEADVNAKDENGRTALHLLARRGTGREAIRALVRAGADIYARDMEGNTPLDLARKASRRTATHEFVSLGADKNA